MKFGGADDRLVRKVQVCRVEQERSCLGTTQASVKGDQFLERAPLFEIGFEEAANHDVGDMWETIGAQKVPRRVRREPRKRVLACSSCY